ncbi:MAG: hypothetical protein OES20_18965, partial [Gammaproteobacteria bacterium]|nr:hypothetical protein [Gammaproteobacteria bacterium]
HGYVVFTTSSMVLIKRLIAASANFCKPTLIPFTQNHSPLLRSPIVPVRVCEMPHTNISIFTIIGSVN